MTGNVQPRREGDWAQAWLASLRPAHWVKNVLVLAPMVFAHEEPTASLLIRLGLAFVLCSMVASAGYLLNDILDRTADRQHPTKSARPVASGLVDVNVAGFTAAGLSVSALLIALLLFDINMAILLAFYLLVSALYSAGLKRLPLLDVCILSTLFCWRLLIGGEASGVAVSEWLLAFAFSLFLTLAVAKRLDEVAAVHPRADGAVPGRGYDRRHRPGLLLLSASLGAITIGTLAAYIALRAGPDALYRHEEWLWVSTAPLAFWLIHVIARAASGRLHGDPVVFAVSDPLSLVLGIAVAGLLIAAV